MSNKEGDWGFDSNPFFHSFFLTNSTKIKSRNETHRGLQSLNAVFSATYWGLSDASGWKDQ